MRVLPAALTSLTLLVSAGAMAQTPPAASNPPAPPAEASLIGPALNVSEIARSLKFYTDGLGMKHNLTMGPDARREYMLGFGADPRSPAIILLFDATAAKHPAVQQGSGYDRLVVRSPDLNALAARLSAAGYPHGEIHDVAMGYRMMMVSDPDGYKLELVQLAPRR